MDYSMQPAQLFLVMNTAATGHPTGVIRVIMARQSHFPPSPGETPRRSRSVLAMQHRVRRASVISLEVAIRHCDQRIDAEDSASRAARKMSSLDLISHCATWHFVCIHQEIK